MEGYKPPTESEPVLFSHDSFLFTLSDSYIICYSAYFDEVFSKRSWTLYIYIYIYNFVYTVYLI